MPPPKTKGSKKPLSSVTQFRIPKEADEKLRKISERHHLKTAAAARSIFLKALEAGIEP